MINEFENVCQYILEESSWKIIQLKLSKVK